MYTLKERKEYNENRDRACERLNITKNQYNWLRRKGNELHKLYEDNCNGVIDEAQSTEQENNLYDIVDEYVKELNLFVYYQTDPRGATIYLDVKPPSALTTPVKYLLTFYRTQSS